MQAVILAAGMGKRLKELTKDQTKCMVEVNGIKLIERMLRILEKKCFSRIIIVIGYCGEALRQFVDKLEIHTPVFYVENEVYSRTNNIYSLFLARHFLLEDDTLLLESDLIFEESAVDLLMDDPRKTLALVDTFESWMDGTCFVLDQEDRITDFISGKLLQFSNKNQYYKTVNIYKFSKEFSAGFYVPFLQAYSSVMGNNEYYESVLKIILAVDKNVIRAKRLEGQLWYEIDDAQDLDIAETLFIEDGYEKYKRLTSRYGGYWRFPHLKDFCYLVNPYFPTAHMVEELKSNFESLLRQYPSGMDVNCLLAAKNFGIHREHIVVGNGAAELIKALMEALPGKIGIIRPTFEEYPNRCKDRCVIYDCAEDDFDYKPDKIKNYFLAAGIRIMVLINPDNPTGHYLNKKECMDFLEWCEEHQITMVLDESFIDFAEPDDTFLSENLLCRYPNLFVIKSISKCYGVPGLRLGILAGSREETIRQIRKEVSIWNINSMAEFYMQIYEKYKASYEEALHKIKEERDRFYQQLQHLDGWKVYPSQANYFMCELCNGLKSADAAAGLLKYNILIKDLTDKIGNGKQYIRIAVRDRADNEMFVKRWKEYVTERTSYAGD